ncbi:TolB family protein [Haliangium sp.]
MVLAVSLVSAAATAQEHPEGVVFVRDAALYFVPTEGKTEAVELGSLGDDAGPVTRLTASPGGDAVLVEYGDRVALVSLRGPSARLRVLACAPPAYFDHGGHRVACTGPANRLAVHELEAGIHRLSDIVASQVKGFLDDHSLVLVNGQELWAETLEPNPTQRRLAPHLPTNALLIGPHGHRAVGVYPPLRDHKSAAIYGFKLDGEGVRRRLLAKAVPVAWSHDGEWIAVQGERVGGCLMRPTGGQYKCWRRFDALSLSPDGGYLLLSKPADGDQRVDLYAARRDGVHPDAPRLIVRGATGPAVWVPATSGSVADRP